jgi:hypothetical protein
MFPFGSHKCFTQPSNLCITVQSFARQVNRRQVISDNFHLNSYRIKNKTQCVELCRINFLASHNKNNINPLKTKRRLPYLKIQFVPRCKHFSSRL